jgi:hypothetical protein
LCGPAAFHWRSTGAGAARNNQPLFSFQACATGIPRQIQQRDIADFPSDTADWILANFDQQLRIAHKIQRSLLFSLSSRSRLPSKKVNTIHRYHPAHPLCWLC